MKRSKKYSPSKFMERFHSSLDEGFTLIEIMIATSIFLIVVLMSVQSLLSVNKANQVTQRMREQMDTLSFVMEDMVRNIRVGTNFQCMDGSEPSDISIPHSCPIVGASGTQRSFKVAFEGFNGDPANPADQIIYWFAQDPADGKYYIYKSKEGNGAIGQQMFKKMTSGLITIDSAKSGFSVFNAEQTTDATSPDYVQPRIILRITGSIKYQNETLPFDLQTTVTPRTYDA